ncbi:MAG: hypothetical protein JW850_20900 [Thermoflexales bacterium]|nr:hypothetical protein [Thermoflexales bacterium]
MNTHRISHIASRTSQWAVTLVAVGLVLAGCIQRPVSTLTPAPLTTPGATIEPPVITGGDTQLPLAAPTSLIIQQRTFAVTAVEIQQGQWKHRSGQPDSAQWVYGTLINYVLGLEASPENTALFQTLSEADTLQLVLANQRILTFQFSGRLWVEQNAASELFQQFRPGLTLALLGDEGAKRLVITASYVSGAEPTPSTGVVATIGTAVQVGEARVSVLSGELIKQSPALPVGFAYYLVDFRVECLGPNTLDASMFQMDLIDGENRPYALSIQASQLGQHGPAGGQLSPGQVLTATAGYLVPQAISGPAVVWSFSSRPGLQAPARFQLALVEPIPTPNPRSLARIQIDSVGYSHDTTEILIAGGIGNPSDQVVLVAAEDVVLESGGARMSLNAADPVLPWNIAPGESRAFTLRYPRMAPGIATLHILQWSFELSGLQ